jgi:drug/metabolite transporter (DMT)-like permease
VTDPGEREGTLYAAASVAGAALLPVLAYGLGGGLHPAALALWLTLPALAACIAHRLLTGRPIGAVLSGPDVPALALVGLLGSAVPLLLIAGLASLGVPGTTVSVLLLTEVAWSLALGRLVLGEGVRARHVLAAAAVAGGAALAVGGSVRLAPGWPLALLVPLSWQLGHATYRSRLPHRSPEDVLCARLLFGSAILLLVLALLAPAGQALPTASAGLRLALAGAVCNWAQLLLWYRALARINLTKATTIMMTYPAASFLLFALSGAPAGPSQWAGLALATAGAAAAGLMPSERSEDASSRPADVER